MSRIDYSKWDNVDASDSESDHDRDEMDMGSLVSEMKTAREQPNHTLKLGEDEVQVVLVFCNYDSRKSRGAMFVPFVMSSYELETGGEISPVSQKIGFPIQVFLERPDRHAEANPDYDNQALTYMMIDPVSGFAPPRYQSSVGNATLLRVDGKPLLKLHVEALWMFCSRVLDVFGDDPRKAQQMITKERFRTFFQTYMDEQGWANIPSPYDN